MSEVSKLFRPKTVGLAYTMARNAGQGRAAATATAGRQLGDQAKREIPRTYRRVRDNATTTQKVGAAAVGGVGLGSYLTKSAEDTMGDPFQISKKAPLRDSQKEFRNSYFEPFNMRSKTQVRNDTWLRRGIRYIGGSAVGAGAGGGVGSVVGAIATHGDPVGRAVGEKVGAGLGGAVGATVGRTANIRMGDTTMTRRKDGAKARTVISPPGWIPDVAIYRRKKPKG